APVEDRHPPLPRPVPPLLDAALPGLRRRQARGPAHDARRRRHPRPGALARRRRPGRGLLQRLLRRPRRGERERLGHARGRLDALGADAAALKPFAAGITNDNVEAFLAAGERTFCGRTKYAKGRHRWTVPLEGAELDRLVAAEYPAVGHVTALTPVRRGVS